MSKFFYILLFIFSLLTYFWIYYHPTNKISDTSFPRALLAENGPIHPECVLRTQFGDCSRLDPQYIHEDFETNLKDDYKILSSSLETDLYKNSVKWTVNYIGEFDTREHTYSVTYQAWPVDDATSLVLLDHYTTDSTGRFTELGMVKREGDFLINCGEIAGGDRAHGTVSVDFFENHILQYRSSETPSSLIAIFLDRFSIKASFDPPPSCSAINYAGESIWRCQIQNNHVTDRQLLGIDFNEGLYTEPNQNESSNSELNPHSTDPNPFLSFPKALLTENGPIHPDCVVSTQFGDRSRWEPKYIFKNDQDICEEENIRTYLHANFNTTPLTYICDYYGENAHYRAAYQAWLINDSVSLVLTNHYWGGSGKFTNLGLVKREGDFLINCGEIAGGDRAHGTVSVDFFENNILQYSCIGTASDLMSILQDQFSVKASFDSPLTCSPADSDGRHIWRRRIDNETITDSQLVGIRFDH